MGPDVPRDDGRFGTNLPDRIKYSEICPSDVDPEYARRDARAVEDPISAVFDLAESVERQTPKIRKMLRYVRVFVSLWLLLDFFLILVTAAISPGGAPGVAFVLFLPIVGFLLGMRYASQPSTRVAFLIVAIVFGAFQVLAIGGLLFLGAVLVALFLLGFVILELMRDLRSFFDYFALRHRVIQRVRQSDPVVYVPEGKDSVQRILAHLTRTSPDVRAVIAHPGAMAAPALLTGRTGLTYSFDAYIHSDPTTLARFLGLGAPGFTIFVKSFENAPSLADLQAVKRAVEDLSQSTRIPPARVIAVWRARGDASIAPDAYEFLTREAVRVKLGGSTYVCSIELAREGDDGTYDFVPVVVDSVRLPGPSPAGA